MTESTLDVLGQDYAGAIIGPNHQDYDAARTTLIGQGKPAIIFRPHTTNDIAVAIKYARAHNLTLSVKSGGHSVAGFSTNNGGVVIDLHAFSDVEIIDTDKNIVRLGSGAVWGDVADTLKEYGLALTSGDTRSVGVGGLTLGGGIGWMVRKYGLAIDNLIGAEIVTANGDTLQVDANEHPDLFWAIRGGGGNFGVVSHFDFQATTTSKVHAGMLFFALDDIERLIIRWRDIMRKADENLTTILNILPNFNGNPPMAMLGLCYASDDEQKAKIVIESLQQIGKLTNEMVSLKDYAEVLEDAHPPKGVNVIVNNALIKEFTDEFIAGVADAYSSAQSMILQIRSLGGAMAKVDPDATAFAHRDSEVLLMSPAFLSPNASDEDITKALEPWLMITDKCDSAYCNFLSTATVSDIYHIYPPKTYERLVRIKKKYDPENIFNQNYNIKPA